MLPTMLDLVPVSTCVHGGVGHLRCGCRELNPYLSLSEVHQGLPSAALLGVEQPAKLGALYHPIEQMVRVGACAGAGSQVLAAKWLDSSYERQKGPVRLRPGARARPVTSGEAA